MRSRARMLPLLLVVAMVAIWAGPADAFHSHGVARCSGCHTMHNSLNGQPMGDNPVPGQGNPWLLLRSTPTDTCLSCHAVVGRGYTVWGAHPNNPLGEGATHGGGDFVFLLAPNVNDNNRPGQPVRPGSYAGHNVVTVDKGVGVDPRLITAPGGNFESAYLACSSCHDPHGTDSFRILYGANRIVRGRDAAGNEYTYTFTAEAPQAVGVALVASAWESDTNHTAYQSGMSEWCGNCHGDFHNNQASFVHPSGTAMGAAIAAIYNAYRGTTDCVENPPVGGSPCGTGTAADAYLAMVPFEDTSNGDVSSTLGPSANSTVMCLSCHRAHASSAMSAGRWDFQVQFLKEDGEASGSFPLPNPYDDNQKSLCNQCHAKDAYDYLYPDE
jgi:hypothetical protein